jgi:hypothetical protein
MQSVVRVLWGGDRARVTRDRTYRGYLVRENPWLQLLCADSDELPLRSEMTRWAISRHPNERARQQRLPTKAALMRENKEQEAAGQRGTPSNRERKE